MASIINFTLSAAESTFFFPAMFFLLDLIVSSCLRFAFGHFFRYASPRFSLRSFTRLFKS